MVERGTIHGYTAINEARENLLYVCDFHVLMKFLIVLFQRIGVSKDDEALEEHDDSSENKRSSSPAHIFSPVKNNIMRINFHHFDEI